MSKTAPKAREIVLTEIKGDYPISYHQTLMDVLRVPLNRRQDHPDPEEISEAASLIRKLRSLSPGDTLLLNESEWKFIDTRVQKFPYPLNTPEVDDFRNDIKNAPEVPLKKDE